LVSGQQAKGEVLAYLPGNGVEIISRTSLAKALGS
jgi:hypothetical protein